MIRAIHAYANVGCVFQPDQDLHAIIYNSSNPPNPLQKDTVVYNGDSLFAQVVKRDESGMSKKPIRMSVDHVSYSLSPTSRLHFGRVYYIKHDVRVKSVGVIHVNSIRDFVNYYNSVQVGFSIPKVIENVTKRLAASDSKSKITTHAPERVSHEDGPEDPVKVHEKARTNLEALCVSDEAQLLVIARYHSDDHRLDVSRYPNRLNFKRGDRIKVLNSGELPSRVASLTDRMPSDVSSFSNDSTSPSLTWWLGELDGCQGEFPWWYVDIE